MRDIWGRSNTCDNCFITYNKGLEVVDTGVLRICKDCITKLNWIVARSTIKRRKHLLKEIK